ncbi:MAG: hypothetical protein IT201_02835 [Thermoleophilia bacterium]|nr:hypothetical protein [Thermoleophilia bacterium]
MAGQGRSRISAARNRRRHERPPFAAGAHRDEAYRGAEVLGVGLDEQIAFCVAAMRPIAARLGLRTGEAG